MQSRKKASKVCTKTKSCWQKATLHNTKTGGILVKENQNSVFVSTANTLFMPSSPLPHIHVKVMKTYFKL